MGQIVTTVTVPHNVGGRRIIRQAGDDVDVAEPRRRVLGRMPGRRVAQGNGARSGHGGRVRRRVRRRRGRLPDRERRRGIGT